MWRCGNALQHNPRLIISPERSLSAFHNVYFLFQTSHNCLKRACHNFLQRRTPIPLQIPCFVVQVKVIFSLSVESNGSLEPNFEIAVSHLKNFASLKFSLSRQYLVLFFFYSLINTLKVYAERLLVLFALTLATFSDDATPQPRAACSLRDSSSTMGRI